MPVSLHDIIVNSVPKSGVNLLLPILLRLGYNRFGGSLQPQSSNGFFLKPLVRRSIWPGSPSVSIGFEIDSLVSRSFVQRVLSRRPFASLVPAHMIVSDVLSDIICQSDYRMILLCRDPRDVILSYIRYSRTTKKHLLYSHFARFSDQQIFELLLNGSALSPYPIRPFETAYIGVLRWIEVLGDRTLLVRFEDLVGSLGGGSDDDSLASLGAIASFVGCTPPLDVGIVRDCFGVGPTFREGVVGSWRSCSSIRSSSFDRLSGLCSRFGYV